jgi:hypothetical protein
MRTSQERCKIRKRFFFEKKNQKTFAFLAASTVLAMAGGLGLLEKAFLAEA